MSSCRETVAVGLLLMTAVGGQAADYYVARNNSSPQSPYDTWVKAATNIQFAVNAAVDRSTVWVAPGVYTLPTNAAAYERTTSVVHVAKALHVRSSNGVASSTIIDGGGRYRGVFLQPSGGKKITLDGFTITNCWATNAGGIGICRMNNATAVVQNCVIKYNKTKRDGAGIGLPNYNDSQQSLVYVISNCLILGNQATNGTGGGIADQARGTLKKPTITHCTIVSNTSVGGGTSGVGGIYLYPAANTQIRNCEFKHNRSGVGADSGRGGAVLAGGGGAYSMGNCLVYDNLGDWGAIYGASTVRMRLVNCTIVSNRTYAVRLADAQGMLFCTNTIFYYNTYGPGTVGTQSYVNCCIDPKKTFDSDRVNTISNNPQFVSAVVGDFRLTFGSKCVDAGVTLPWMNSAFDLDGTERVNGTVVDMGCYELEVSRGSTVFIR